MVLHPDLMNAHVLQYQGATHFLRSTPVVPVVLGPVNTSLIPMWGKGRGWASLPSGVLESWVCHISPTPRAAPHPLLHLTLLARPCSTHTHTHSTHVCGCVCVCVCGLHEAQVGRQVRGVEWRQLPGDSAVLCCAVLCCAVL